MSRLPTEAEMHQWYVGIRDLPGAVALRERIGDESHLQILTSRERPWRATSHATLDGDVPLCGRRVARFTLEAPGYTEIGCHACRRTVAELELI